MPSEARVLKYQNTILDKRCIECGEEFRQIRRLKGICSEGCKIVRRLRFRPQTFIECKKCGRKFGPIERLNRIFCSNKCKVEYLQGEKHPAWEGGKSRETQRARAKMEYKRWRDTIFVRDNFTCWDCGKRSKKGERIEINAHHIKGFAENKESRYDLDNGITLCVKCHRKIHFKK